MNIRKTRLGSALCAVFCLGMITAASVSATVVWDLNPNGQNGPVGSSSRIFTSQGYSITAYGFDNNGGIGSAHELYYKNVVPVNGAVERGLGITNTPDNELQAGANGPLQFMQFDVGAILAAGLIHGQISVGSLQAGEAFAIYGSNALGTLGSQLGGTYGSSFDNQFVNLPDYGTYRYYSIVAAADDVLPVALRADMPPVPEMNAMFPIIALMLLVLSVHALRRRAAKVA
jgi:hypothetical protein